MGLHSRLQVVERYVSHVQVEVLRELAQERAQRQMLEEQLVSALNINAEMKLALSLQDEETERSTFTHRLNKLKSQASHLRPAYQHSQQFPVSQLYLSGSRTFQGPLLRVTASASDDGWLACS